MKICYTDSKKTRKGLLLMKMITAIVQKKDGNEVSRALRDAGFEFTKIATVGGFLSAGNVTLLIGTEDEKVDEAIEILRQNCRRRMESVPTVLSVHMQSLSYATEVLVGGATVFVTDVVRFEKM